MSEPIDPSEPDFQFSGMNRARQPGAVHNLMEHGSGTPWEERGSLGTVPAFIKTCMQSMTKPSTLLHAIRRPDTSHESTGFVIACGLMWGIGLAIYRVLARPADSATIEVDSNLYWIATGLMLVAAPAVLWLSLNLFALMFRKLVTTELKGRAPVVLIYNVFAYTLGPSLVAVATIPLGALLLGKMSWLGPIVGMAVPIVWIGALLMVAGTGRLYISQGGTIVATLLNLIVVIALLFAGYFVINLAWGQVTGGAVIVLEPVKKG